MNEDIIPSLLEFKPLLLYYNRYYKLINHYKNINVKVGEKHHILPKSLYKDYKNNKTNIIKVPCRVHFILHFLLYKMFSNNKNNIPFIKMSYAFNNMKRIGNKSLLYKQHREDIKEIISKNNKGLRHYYNIHTNKVYTTKLNIILNNDYKWGQPPSTKRKEFFKNHILVKDNKGKVFYINKNTYYQNTNLYKDAKIGRKHTLETKIKMSANGIKNKICYHNENNTIIYIDKNEKPPKGFKKGKPLYLKELQSKKIQEKVYYHNNDKCIRINKNEKPPKGFKKGRGVFNNKGNKGMKYYHKNGIVKMFKNNKAPKGWTEGRIPLKYKLFNNKGKVGVFSKKEIIEMYPLLLKTTKEKPIGYNKNYINRLSKPEYIGFYIKEIQ